MASLYDTDFYKWSQEQAQLLRLGRFNEIDRVNIIEEIEDMGKSQKRALASRLEVLLMHLLKWQYQPAFRGTSWQLTIEEQRQRIAEVIEENPSLIHGIEELIERSYRYAKRSAMRETGIHQARFPPNCSWAFSQFMNNDFWPETDEQNQAKNS